MITKDILKDLRKLEKLLNFSNLNENFELLSIKNKKVYGKNEIETPKKV